MDYLSLLGALPKLFSIFTTVKSTIGQGGNPLDIVNRLFPEIMPVITDIGKTVFPSVTPALQPAAGADVIFDSDGTMWVQNSLNTINKNTALDVDGIYGNGTKAAVKAYQTFHGLKAIDGWAGPKTSASIALELAKLIPATA